jgi:anti-sigma factor RsiW
VNCDQIQELAPLWLTGELEGARMSAVAEHLAGCGACTHLLAEQNSLDARIRTALLDEIPDTARTERLVRHRITWERQRRWLVVGGIAALLLIGFEWQKRENPDRLYADAARDHQLEVVEHQPRRWRSEPAAIEVVAARFGLTRAKAVDLAPEGYRLVRAKVCGLDGGPALHLVYGNGSTDSAREISVYVRQGATGLRNSETAEIGPERLASARNGRYSTVVVTTGSLEECRKLARRTAELL